jgi:hypothetical protein
MQEDFAQFVTEDTRQQTKLRDHINLMFKD